MEKSALKGTTMNQTNEKNASNLILPAKRGKAFIFYIITIALNFSLFTIFALIWVGMSSFNNIIPWEGWIVILIWALLLGSLVASLFRVRFGCAYLFIELLTIIAFTVLTESYALAVFALLSLVSVLLPYVFLLRKALRKSN